MEISLSTEFEILYKTYRIKLKFSSKLLIQKRNEIISASIKSKGSPGTNYYLVDNA
jgi:hypothetical protein